MQEIIIIVAMAENRVIGRDNAMPWSIKGNLAHFKEMTMGWPCIMGRKTWESLPRRPLPGRLNIVISSSVPKTKLCPQDQALSPRPSSVPRNELCPQRRALSPRPSSVPENQALSPTASSVPNNLALSSTTSSVPNGELCPQDQALSPKMSSVPQFFTSLPAAIEHCAAYEKIFICGGESIYRQALPLATQIDLTLIPGQYEGDAFFPEIDPAYWEQVKTVKFDEFSIITYAKINNFEKEQS